MGGNKDNKQPESENKNRSFLDRIKDTTAAKVLDYKYKKLNELTVNQKYLITDITKVTTKYGDKLVIHLQYQGLNNAHNFRTYLPDRYSRLSNEDIEDLRSSDFNFIYKGKDELGHHVIDFE